MAKRHYDVLTAMIRWEQGSLTEAGTNRLFRYLVRTGMVWTLQGCYGREAARRGLI